MANPWPYGDKDLGKQETLQKINKQILRIGVSHLWKSKGK